MLLMSDRFRRRRLWRKHSRHWSKINQCLSRIDERKEEKQVSWGTISQEEFSRKFQIIPTGHHESKSSAGRSQKYSRNIQRSDGAKIVFGSRKKWIREKRKDFDRSYEGKNWDINQLEAKFGQEERRLEKEIISLKIQLKEAKKTK